MFPFPLKLLLAAAASTAIENRTKTINEIKIIVSRVQSFFSTCMSVRHSKGQDKKPRNEAKAKQQSSSTVYIEKEEKEKSRENLMWENLNE